MESGQGQGQGTDSEIYKADMEKTKEFLRLLGKSPERLDRLEKIVGYPAGEHTKPLFEIISALQKELLEIGMKVEELEKAKRGKIKEE